jgi:uncharacterized pyridoxamine 5'-phosphate oxidase family protein
MNDIEINDVRSERDFKGITFSEFKKTDVKKEIIKNLYNSKIEPACYWSAELICAGHYTDLWDTIINFYSKHIHIGNPKLITYLELRINNFKDIVTNGYRDQELRLRNNEKMRKLFCEVMCVLCEARKKHCYAEVKVKKEDFDLTQMTERFKAPNIRFAEEIFLKEDPKELFIAANELAYNLSEEGKNSVSACYWMEWIIEFENICKQKKDKFKCERRVFANVESKYQMDIVWIIWDIFIFESNKRSNLIQRIVNSALKIFCLKYTSGCHKKRRFLMYFAIEIFTELYSLQEELVRDKNKIITITQNINKIYKQIKKNEHSPGTDYLYQNIKASNLEKTIAKLETMNNLGAEYIPRID